MKTQKTSFFDRKEKERMSELFKRLSKQVAIIIVTVMVLAQASAIFPLFQMLPFSSKVEAATSIDFENQQWLIDEIIRQVRVTRPLVSDISEVTTAELQAVTIINIDSKTLDGNAPGVDGYIPAAINLLPNLTNLSIINTNLTGSIPSTISSLTKLQVLDLHGNNLNGSIPSGITSLTNLTYLSLASNKLTGALPAAVLSSSFAKVVTLDLSDNQLSGPLPDPASAMTALKTLNLSYNQFVGFSSTSALPTNFTMTRFPAMTSVNISHNPLNAPWNNAFTASSSVLQNIDLSYCRIN